MFGPFFFSVRLPTLLAILWRKQLRQDVEPDEGRKQPSSFIIFRLDALGDVVLTTPLFRALKQHYPRSRVTVVVQPSYRPLLATNPHVDEILTPSALSVRWVPQRLVVLLAALSLYWTALKGRRFDVAISPRWDTDEHLATLLCALTPALHRVGYSSTATTEKQKMNAGFDRAFDICLPPGAVRHEVLRNLEVARALGASALDESLELHITDRDRRAAATRLANIPAGRKIVAVAIGARSPGRRWPLASFAETLNRLGQAAKVQPIILCSQAESQQAQGLARMLRNRALIVSGAPLRELCGVLESCHLFIGNDSGCAHLAAAMDCKVIVISRHPRDGSPNHPNSPMRFSPRGRSVRVGQPATGRDDCIEGCVVEGPHCITSVTSDDVVPLAESMLLETSSPVLPRITGPTLPKAHRLLSSHAADALRRAVVAIRADERPPV